MVCFTDFKSCAHNFGKFPYYSTFYMAQFCIARNREIKRCFIKRLITWLEMGVKKPLPILSCIRKLAFLEDHSLPFSSKRGIFERINSWVKIRLYSQIKKIAS